MKIARADKIIEYMQNHDGRASVAQLCEEFNISDMTVRRDLIALEKEGKLLRYHGGATLLKMKSLQPHATPFQDRLHENNEIKMKLGKVAAQFLFEKSNSSDVNSVYIASGSTLYCMTTQIMPSSKNIIYVTDNVFCAQALGSNAENSVISVGGEITLPSLNVIGYFAEKMICSFSYDYAFIGVGSIDIDGMIYYYNFLENGTFLAALNSAKKVVVVADSSKLGKKIFVQCRKMSENFILITDSGIKKEFYDSLIKLGVKIIIAE